VKNSLTFSKKPKRQDIKHL